MSLQLRLVRLEAYAPPDLDQQAGRLMLRRLAHSELWELEGAVAATAAGQPLTTAQATLIEQARAVQAAMRQELIQEAGA
jgi:hypothetical protein